MFRTALAATISLGLSGLANGSQAIAVSGNRIIEAGPAGLQLSDDRGQSYAAIGAPTAATHLDRDATIAAVALVGPDLLVADGFGRVFRSDDGGGSWLASDDGLPVPFQRRSTAVTLAAAGDGLDVVYALLDEPLDHLRSRARLYRSGDGGRSWQAMKDLPGRVAGGLRVEVIDDLTVRLEVDGHERLWRFTDRLAVDSEPDPVFRPAGPERRLGGESASLGDFDTGNVTVIYDDGTLAPVNDLSGSMVRFDRRQPDGYDMRFVTPTGVVPRGSELPLDDDSVVPVDLPFGFPYFDRYYGRIFVSDNGNVTLGAADWAPDAVESSESFAEGPPRIAVFWDDFSPTASGQVLYEEKTDHVTVTWFFMPQFGDTDINSFQLELWFDGSITMQYDVGLPDDGLTGLSPGLGANRFYLDLNRDAPLAFPVAAVYEQFHPDLLIADRILHRFYHCHPDDYDQVLVWGGSAWADGVAGGEVALHQLVKNNVQGIGQPLMNQADSFGSGGRLESFVNMNALGPYPLDPNEAFVGTRSVVDLIADMSAKRFGAYIRFDDGGTASTDLLGDVGNWSFYADTDASVVGGHRFEDQGGNSFLTLGVTESFSPLDQYLMGLRGDFETPPVGLLRNIAEPGQCSGGACTPSSEPHIGTLVSADRELITIGQIQAVEGARVPAYGIAPETFNQAWILVVPAGEEVSIADVDLLAAYQVAWEVFFTTATESRGFVVTRLEGDVTPPTSNVGNGLRASRSGLDVRLDWSAGVVFPRRYVVHGTSDKVRLADTPAGIASTGILELSNEIERAIDPLATLPLGPRPSPYFYEVFARDCADATVLTP